VSGKTAFAYADIVATDELAAHLGKLAEGLRRGSLGLEGQGQQLSLCPAGILKLEVKAKADDRAGELVLEMSWKDTLSTETERLKVSTGIEADTDGGMPPGNTLLDQTADA
jgi:amphi-Trp domain-containing protein